MDMLMDQEAIDKLEKLLSAFSNGRLIDCGHVAQIAFDNDIRLEQLMEYGRILKSKVPHFDASKLQSAELRQCPECSTRVFLRHVNKPLGPLNVFGFRSCWECPSCGWEKYSCLCYNAELVTNGHF